jgi:ornithine decarboxylase
MGESLRSFGSVREAIRTLAPREPVYCIYPHVYGDTAKSFVAGFPGRVLYAVKANDHPLVLGSLIAGGVRHFDCASLPEIETVRRLSEDAKCYFMTPVRLRGAARSAQGDFGVRHFMIDHLSGLDRLAAEIELPGSVVFARMAVSHRAAMIDLSNNRFGAPPAAIPEILAAIRSAGAEPALAFNVGSSVTSPDAYTHSLGLARDVLRQLDFRVRLLDIGGGFPRPYPGFEVPPLDDYFDAVRGGLSSLPLADDAELMAEPGRALAAPGVSAIVEVCLRKEDRLYLNDGMYGIFWELRFRGHRRFPVRAFRDGEALTGELQSFRLYGPTCDSSDELPGNVDLPADVRPGDHLEFGRIGAYSLAGRTRFNGFYSEDIITISDDLPVS